MKNVFKLFGLIAILAIALIGCGGGDTTTTETTVPADTPRTLTFGTDCKVTIKSNDQFTAAEWTALCDKAVGAIERGYNSDYMPAVNKPNFENKFRNYNISIVLLKTATYDCEVKEGNYTTMYLKISALDTVDLRPAVWALCDEEAYHQP